MKLIPPRLRIADDGGAKLVIYSTRNRQDVAITGNLLELLESARRQHYSKGGGNCLLFGWKWQISNEIAGRDLIFDFDSNWNPGLLLLLCDPERFGRTTVEDCQHWEFPRLCCIRRHYYLIDAHNFCFPTQNLEFGTKIGCYRGEGEDLVACNEGKLCAPSVPHTASMYNKLSIFILLHNNQVFGTVFFVILSSSAHSYIWPDQKFIPTLSWCVCVRARQFPF